jgi:hypothetical protein
VCVAAAAADNHNAHNGTTHHTQAEEARFRAQLQELEQQRMGAIEGAWQRREAARQADIAAAKARCAVCVCVCVCVCLCCAVCVALCTACARALRCAEQRAGARGSAPARTPRTHPSHTHSAPTNHTRRYAGLEQQTRALLLALQERERLLLSAESQLRLRRAELEREAAARASEAEAAVRRLQVRACVHVISERGEEAMVPAHITRPVRLHVCPEPCAAAAAAAATHLGRL